MNIIGQQIEHERFGVGRVVELNDGYLSVRFLESVKRFVYPDAFAQFLTLTDVQAQKSMSEILSIREKADQLRRQELMSERARMLKIQRFKPIASSHVAFDIAPEDVMKVRANRMVYTGSYQSGAQKGQPRLAKRMQPNSLCLLTLRGAKAREQERKLFGAFMVQEDYFGKDACDERIPAHSEHCLFLPADCDIPFWSFFEQDRAMRWSGGVYQYCTDDVTNRILLAMMKSFEATEQQKAAVAFYQYFCRLNNLNPPKEYECEDVG